MKEELGIGNEISPTATLSYRVRTGGVSWLTDFLSFVVFL